MPLFLLEVLMRTIKEIHELEPHCKDKLYGETRRKQREELTYINDTFKIDIKNLHREFHSGIAREIVDAAAQQINTSNPQALVSVLSGKQEAGKRISAVLNQEWIPTFLRQSPNPTKEYVKGLVSRGEAYYKIVHNENWADCPECRGRGKIGKSKCKYCKGEGKVDASKRIGLPVKLITPEPMVVYGSPQEDDDGRPDWVIVSYERQLRELIPLYPDIDFSLLKDEKQIKWLEYIDRDIRYCEANGIAVTDGIEENIYPFVPYVRKYSGFGRRSPDGELAELICGDIRFAKDLIMEEAMLRSDIASILHIFAHQPILIKVYGQKEVELMERVLPSGEMFQRLHDLQGEILRKYPLIGAALPFPVSGRSKDITASLSRRRYDTVIENTQNAKATILEMGLEICNTIPDWKPAKLNKGDLDVDYKISIDLKAADPVEEDRKSSQGEKLWNFGQGSMKKRLTGLWQHGL